MLVLPNSTPVFAKREAGGKGYGLYRAAQLGLAIPPWVILGRREFRAFTTAAGIATAIAERLAALAQHKLSAAAAAAEIEQIFIGAPPSGRLQEMVELGVRILGPDKVLAVRSSGSEEDGAGHSFAGQFTSFLCVAGRSAVLDAVKRCFASAFSERCLAYRRERGLALHGIEVAVILQEMLNPEVSGVLFTCNPLTEELDEYVISAVYGVGEGLVSGALDADSFWIDSATGARKRSEITAKKEALRQSESGRLERAVVPGERQNVPALEPSELLGLWELGRTCVAAGGGPQDIEWAISRGTLYLLQTRPVTSLKHNLTGFPNLWDNSNIIESYGGLTTPLSFSFALNNYRLVYQQFCEILGVSGRIVREMDYYLRNMLGCINGRVYYNLYNWYKLIGVLPGFKANREFMETMMGVRQPLTEELDARISPHPSWYTWRGRLRKLRVGLRFVYFHFTISFLVKRFQRDFHRKYLRFRGREYAHMPGDQIFQHYLAMEREMIGDWQAPIINDFLCMVHFGLLKKLSSRWLAQLDPHIHNDLLAADGNLESTEPTKELMGLAAAAAQTEALRKLIQETDAPDVLEQLNQSPYQDFYQKIQAYIARFGFRCMNEMKLEEIDLFSDPAYLFSCLKNYLDNPQIDPAVFAAREQETRQGAEGRLKTHLGGLKLIIYRWVLTQARQALRNRENTRFARTRAYGVARSMFQAMGQDLARDRIIEDPADIFFLTLEEIYGIYQGTLSAYRLRDFVSLRRAEYRDFALVEPDQRFLTRGAVYWRNAFSEPPPENAAAVGEDYDLKGTPCCAGVVEGVVKILSSAQDDLTLRGEILVAQRTDPGWVPLYPSVSALLVERGSLLSHSAIVARELGLPTIVRIPGLTAKLRSGMRVRVDAGRGTITILDR